MAKQNYVKALLILMLCFFIGTAGAQNYTSKETSAVKKSGAYYDAKKYDKAIKTLLPVLTNHLTEDALWNLMVEYYYRRYAFEYNKEYEAIMKQVQDAAKKGNTADLKLKNEGHSNQYLIDLLNTCSRATLKCCKVNKASLYLRRYLIDEASDTAVSKDAKDKFDEADEAFGNEDYKKARQLYQEALYIDSNYFKATLYLGDAYYADKQPSKSVSYFKKAISMRPDLLEARKFLVDAYFDMENFDLAYDACIEAIIVHPDLSMFTRLDDICGKLNKTFDRHWFARYYSINQMDVDQSEITDEPWKFYREAKEKIAEYCNDKGVIIKQNKLTTQDYMEAYCWEYMLEKTTSSDFDFAKKMLKEGYLDCYVLVSMYHYSLNGQYQDFAATNADKIRKYFNNYLIY
jgi:tetratricopeptide (TPR) repeat protein